MTEALVIGAVILVAAAWPEVGLAARVGGTAAVLITGLLVLVAPSPAVSGKTPAWMRAVGRAFSRGRVAQAAPPAPAPEPLDPFPARVVIDRMLKFRETEIGEVMVPRIDMVAVDAGDEIGALAAQIEKHRHSRYPVYDGDIDHVIGVVSAFDLLKRGPGPASVRELARPVPMVPGGKHCGIDTPRGA
jgi:hypothetical protein